MKMYRGYKLFNLRKDGSIGPLFINRKQRIELGKWYDAEDHPTKGFAHRPGWHITHAPIAPHLSEKGRVWGEVMFYDYKEPIRPKRQGGLWFTANHMKVVKLFIEN